MPTLLLFLKKKATTTQVTQAYKLVTLRVSVPIRSGKLSNDEPVVYSESDHLVTTGTVSNLYAKQNQKDINRSNVLSLVLHDVT